MTAFKSGIKKFNGKKLRAEILYVITSICSPQESLYVGIKGGQETLEEMKPAKIRDKKTKWEIRVIAEPPTNSGNWIKGEVFCEILERRGIDKQWFREKVN
jgi:hypothetical protein